MPFSGATRRQVLTGAAALGSIAALPLSVTAQQGGRVLKRRNIDVLRKDYPDELKNYLHALSTVARRPKTDPTSYAWQAGLHNTERDHAHGPPGACEHGSELFFPWHRAHLAGFEQILQAADPPRTSNVSIPYWDWTMEPSGKLFPLSFEEPNSLLQLNLTEGPDAGEKVDRRTGPPAPRRAPEEVRKYVVDLPWWRFAGLPQGDQQSYGEVEDKPHNDMHPAVGATLGARVTASDDPIYWSFHAFIDLIWARWQRLHRQEFGAPDATLWLEPKTWKVSDKVTTADWGYEYEYDFGADGPPSASSPPATAVSSAPIGRRPLTIDLDAKTAIVTGRIEPQAPSAGLFLRIQRVKPLPDVTYKMFVFVHPVDVNITSIPDGRGQYLADQFAIWALGHDHGHHRHASDVFVPLEDAIAKLQGSPWRITMLTEPLTAGDDGEKRLFFDGRALAAPVRSLFESFELQER
jgi:tyrosinase